MISLPLRGPYVQVDNCWLLPKYKCHHCPIKKIFLCWSLLFICNLEGVLITFLLWQVAYQLQMDWEQVQNSSNVVLQISRFHHKTTNVNNQENIALAVHSNPAITSCNKSNLDKSVAKTLKSNLKYVWGYEKILHKDCEIINSWMKNENN